MMARPAGQCPVAVSVQSNIGEHPGGRIRADKARFTADRPNFCVALCRAAPSSSRLIVSLAGVIGSRLMPTKLCKLMLASQHKDPLARQYFKHKWIPFFQLRVPFARGENFWIDLSRETCLRRVECIDDTAVIDGAADQNVSVASSRFGSTRDGPESARAESDSPIKAILDGLHRLPGIRTQGHPAAAARHSEGVRVDFARRKRYRLP
jgi:hypothetical protein